MKTLRIIGYHRLTNNTHRSLADQWDSYLHSVGCDIEINARTDAFLIMWETSLSSTIHHILDMIEDIFGDYYDVSELSRSIEMLEDDQTVSFYVGYSGDGEDGEVEVG